MTQPNAPIAYASPITGSGTCSLCHQRPTWKKTLYGHPVCKKCYYKFANRRQLAYIVDSILYTAVVLAIFFGVISQFPIMPESEFGQELFASGVGLVFGLLFVMKDGFSGHSVGRWLTGVQVLDDRSGQPIGFGQSFKRNAILLVGAVPVVGGLASVVVVITLAIQLNKGYRMGDRFARTRVIWKKYARSPVFGGDGMLCESCGYDLTGNQSGVCPECGTNVAARPVAPAMAVIPGRAT